MSEINPPDQNLPIRLIRLGDTVRLHLAGTDTPSTTTYITQLSGTDHAHVITHGGFRSLPIHRNKLVWNEDEKWWDLSL